MRLSPDLDPDLDGSLITRNSASVVTGLIACSSSGVSFRIGAGGDGNRGLAVSMATPPGLVRPGLDVGGDTGEELPRNPSTLHGPVANAEPPRGMSAVLCRASG